MSRAGLVVAAALSLNAWAAPAVITESALSADGAMEVAQAALAQCRKDGQKVSVTVVDATGRVKIMIRDDGAAPHTSEHSLRKAYTALSYKMPSADYGKRASEVKGVAIGPQLLPNITTAAGGLPIKANGATIAAIGVSGTPGSAGGGEHDAKCAEAGIEKVAKELGGK